MRRGKAERRRTKERQEPNAKAWYKKSPRVNSQQRTPDQKSDKDPKANIPISGIITEMPKKKRRNPGAVC